MQIIYLDLSKLLLKPFFCMFDIDTLKTMLLSELPPDWEEGLLAFCKEKEAELGGKLLVLLKNYDFKGKQELRLTIFVQKPDNSTAPLPQFHLRSLKEVLKQLRQVVPPLMAGVLQMLDVADMVQKAFDGYQKQKGKRLSFIIKVEDKIWVDRFENNVFVEKIDVADFLKTIL